MFRWLHTIGVAFIFIASILLLITTISAPVIGDISILRVNLANSSTVSFGTFGHCILDVAPTTSSHNYCSKKQIGYKPVDILEAIEGTQFGRAGTATTNGLTNTFILHPVAAGLAFIAALCSIGGVLGSLVGVIIGVIAWIVTIVVMAIDFTVFGVIKNRVNKNDSNAHAVYHAAMWTCLAAMVLLLLGIIIVFFTCCTERRKRRTSTYRSSKRTSRY